MESVVQSTGERSDVMYQSGTWSCGVCSETTGERSDVRVWYMVHVPDSDITPLTCTLQTPDDHVPDSDITPLTCTHYRLQMTVPDSDITPLT